MVDVKLDLDLLCSLYNVDFTKMYMYASAMQVFFEHMVDRFILLNYKVN